MSSQPAERPPPTRLVRVRQRLVDTGFYLGNSCDFQTNVHWVRDGRADRLAVKPIETKRTDSPGTPLPSPPPDDSFELATISAVIQIDSNDYWLTSDANYRAPTELCPDFATIKPSCVGHMPDVAPFTLDWANVVDNLSVLQDLAVTPKFTLKQGLFARTGPCGPQLKMRHVLFEISVDIQLQLIGLIISVGVGCFRG